MLVESATRPANFGNGGQGRTREGHEVGECEPKQSRVADLEEILSGRVRKAYAAVFADSENRVRQPLEHDGRLRERTLTRSWPRGEVHAATAMVPQRSPKNVEIHARTFPLSVWLTRRSRQIGPASVRVSPASILRAMSHP